MLYLHAFEKILFQYFVMARKIANGLQAYDHFQLILCAKFDKFLVTFEMAGTINIIVFCNFLLTKPPLRNYCFGNINIHTCFDT